MSLLDRARALDAADPLAEYRERFDLPEGVIYLDGNSLGALPKATPARLEEVLRGEWGEGLIRSWNSAGWMPGKTTRGPEDRAKLANRCR